MKVKTHLLSTQQACLFAQATDNRTHRPRADNQPEHAPMRIESDGGKRVGLEKPQIHLRWPWSTMLSISSLEWLHFTGNTPRKTPCGAFTLFAVMATALLLIPGWASRRWALCKATTFRTCLCTPIILATLQLGIEVVSRPKFRPGVVRAGEPPSVPANPPLLPLVSPYTPSSNIYAALSG